MANSQYEYVRAFEQSDILLPNTWIVVRIDGRGFHRLSQQYQFLKPNDSRALNLMNAAAQAVFRHVPDLCVAYGVSDEYSFVFHKSSALFERRASKLVSTVVSTFTAAYVLLWPEHFRPAPQSEGDEQSIDQDRHPLDIGHLPTFDGRAVCYPSIGNLRDYLSWRQVDCHINNLYNTTFWALVQQGNMSAHAAEETLQGTVSADKHETLFSRFGINYNNEPEMYKKGSVVFREYALEDPPGGAVADAAAESLSSEVATRGLSESRTQLEKQNKTRRKAQIVVRHLDLIKDEFWEKRPWILSGKPGRLNMEA